MAHCIVVGGGGFIGGHLAEALFAAGHSVAVVDQNRPFWWKEMPEGISFLHGSLLEPSAIQQLSHISPCDHLFYLAGVSNTQKAAKDPGLAYALATTTLSRVVQAVRRQDGLTSVFVASSSLLSQYLETSLVDGQPTVHEWSRLSDTAPRHPYLTSKLMLEQTAKDMTDHGGVIPAILRYGICYGPRMTPGVLFDYFVKAYLRGQPLTVEGDGSQRRQYLYVKDLVRGHLAAMDAKPIDNTCPVYHLTPPWWTSVMDAVKAFHVISGRYDAPPVHHASARSSDLTPIFCDSSQTSRSLKWAPTSQLIDGLHETIEWYAEHPEVWQAGS